MPYLHFINIKKPDVINFKKTSLKTFSEYADAKLQNIHIIHHNAEIIDEENFGLIKIEWLPRSKTTQEQVKNLLTSYLNKLGYKNIAIYFVNIEKQDYYMEEY